MFTIANKLTQHGPCGLDAFQKKSALDWWEIFSLLPSQEAATDQNVTVFRAEAKSMNTGKLSYVSLLCVAVFSCPFVATADLLVQVNKPKVTGNKAVVKLEMKNTFDVPVQSARATVFLVDGKKQVVGQSTTKWVIGGVKDKPALAAGHEGAYYFIIPSLPSGTTTNLSANVSFNRLILEDGKVANVTRQVIITKTQN